MAARKPLFMGSEGFSEEMATSDEMTLGGLTMGGAIAMGTNKITGVGAATAANDALTYGQSGAVLNGLGITSAADITVSGGGELTGLPATPSGATAAASKAYVDAVASGLDPKGSVVAVKVGANIVVGTGTLGLTIDGVAIDTDGDRVLLTAQTDAKENGIWVAHSGAWTRPTDFAAGADAQGAFMFVEEGTLYADTGWVCTTNDPAVIGTNDLAFTQFSGAGTYTGGDGIAISAGQEITVDLGTDPGLEFVSNKLEVLVNPAGAIEKVTAGIGVNLEASNPSLAIVTNELGVKLSDGVTKDANGLAVALDASASGLEFTGTAGDGTLGINLEATNPTLEVDGSNQLKVKYSATTGGLDQDAAGLKAKVDTTTIAINGSGQLYALGGGEAQRVENTLITATDAVAVGDPVYANGNDTVGKADAAVDAKSRLLGVIRSGAGAAPQNVEVVSLGIAAGVLTGATAGVAYYLQATGGIATTLPTASKRVIQVGKAVNATDLWVDIIDYGKKAA